MGVHGLSWTDMPLLDGLAQRGTVVLRMRGASLSRYSLGPSFWDEVRQIRARRELCGRG